MNIAEIENRINELEDQVEKLEEQKEEAEEKYQEATTPEGRAPWIDIAFKLDDEIRYAQKEIYGLQETIDEMDIED